RLSSQSDLSVPRRKLLPVIGDALVRVGERSSGHEPREPASITGVEPIVKALGQSRWCVLLDCAHVKPPWSRKGNQISISRSVSGSGGAPYRSSQRISRFSSRSCRCSQENIAA